MTRFKNGDGWKICKKSVRNYWGIRLMLDTQFMYYWHTNVNLLGAEYSVSEQLLAYAPQPKYFPNLQCECTRKLYKFYIPGSLWGIVYCFLVRTSIRGTKMRLVIS